MHLGTFSSLFRGAGLLGCLVTSALAQAQASFTDQTAAAGLVFSVAPTGDAPGVPMWGGVSAADFNNDGYPDVFVASGGGTQDALFINQQDGTFANEATAWGLVDLYRGNGTAVGDYDGDGDLDLYVASAGDVSGPVVAGANRLYRNNFAQGSATFTEVAASAGVALTAQSDATVFPFGATFGDYDLDGDLDLFACNWRPGAYQTQDGNRLFRNNGDGTFSDVTVAAGVLVDIAGFSPRFADMNGDRYPELIIAADWIGSKYFRNNADGTFTNLAPGNGTALDLNGMGSTIADFNRDGQFDWYVTSIEDHQGNYLYVNQGNHVYSALPSANGAKNGGWGWGTTALDFDHDGFVDIAETNGWFAGTWSADPAYLFRNNGNMTFTDVAASAGFINNLGGRALVSLDYDLDGDLDLVMSTNDNTVGGPIFLYRSEQSGSNANWLELELGAAGHPGIAPNGEGSTIRISAGGAFQYFNLAGGSNYLGQGELIAHFGLGAATNVDEIVVMWASGTTTVLSNVAANQRVLMTPPAVFTPSLKVADVTVAEGNAGTTNAGFALSLSAAVGADVVVDYATLDGSATAAGNDYLPAIAQATIPAGSATASVDVAVVGDTTVELIETFQVQITAAPGTAILDATATSTINDDDGGFLLHEEFDDAVQSWPVTSGNWSEAGGMLTGSATTGTARVVAPTPWSPSGASTCLICSVETSLTMTGTNQADVVGWRNDWSTFISLTANRTTGRWELKEFRNGKVVKSRRITRTISPNVAYNLRLHYDGTTVRAYIDGQLRMILVPTQPLVAGNAGVRVSTGPAASYEFVKIY